MKTYDAFFPDVLPDVPGCPADIALRAVRQTVIEFCERTLIHQVTQDPLTLRANLSDYDLDAPKEHRVHTIMKVWFKGKPLDPLAPDEINVPDGYNSRPQAGYDPTKAAPRGYTQKDFAQITFLPIPDQTYTSAVTMRVALAPLRDSTQCEDFLFEQWGEFIACGAKARLMLVPGKPYTNPDAAGINQQRYISGVNDARQRASRGNVRSDLRVQLRKP